MLKVHILDELYQHSSNVAHGVEVPAGSRLLFTNGQVGTKPDGTTPGTTAAQAQVVFARVTSVLDAANMALSDIVRLTVFLTDRGDVSTFVEARDQVMGDHKPGAIILIVRGLARPELKIEIEAIAAKVDLKQESIGSVSGEWARDPKAVKKVTTVYARVLHCAKR